VRAAGSTLFRIPIWQGPSIHDLRVHHIPMVTLSPEGQDLDRYGFPPTFFLVPGLEGPGLPESLRPISLAVPMAAGVDSLNAAVATGIVLYRWRCSLANRLHGSRCL
jgi:tRNA G18 (ribose-2'-O)-methylase SpoU